MAEYKLYVLGPSGMITRGLWLDCDDDAAAVEAARHRAWNDRRELWNGTRLVWTFVPEPKLELVS